MRTKDIHQGLAVWATRGNSTRPGIVVHGPEDGFWWVSYTDRISPPGAKLRPAQLARRESDDRDKPARKTAPGR